MAVADLSLHADGGPSTPDARVRVALTAPVIGQFDPAFTAIMDEVMALARAVLCTANERCFPISAPAPAGVEAIVNTLLVEGDTVVVEGSAPYAGQVSAIARGYGVHTAIGDHVAARAQPKLAVVPHLDPFTGALADLPAIARHWHAQGVPVLVDATWTAGGVELRTDDWALDAVVAGVDYCLGAPSGLTLVTYSAALEDAMRQRASPPPTSYLDLLQLQAYWSPERLNHHTAPTSLVYALREALRLLQEEGLEASWSRHARTSHLLAAGFDALGLPHTGQSLVHVVPAPPPEATRQRLRSDFGITVGRLPGPDTSAAQTWRVCLLGADAQPATGRHLVAALASSL